MTRLRQMASQGGGVKAMSRQTQANQLLRERSTAAMESLSATVDARDSYTAGHSRRVQKLSLAIGRELGLSEAELDLLGYEGFVGCEYRPRGKTTDGLDWFTDAGGRSS